MKKIPNRWTLRFSDEELNKVEKVLTALRIKNRNKFIKGLILSTNEETAKQSEAKKYNTSAIDKEELFQLNKIGVNINQITRKINQTDERYFTPDNLKVLKELRMLLIHLINKREEHD